MAEIFDFTSHKKEKEDRDKVLDLDQCTFMLETVTSLLKTMEGKKRGSDIYKMHQANIVKWGNEELISHMNSSSEEQWRKSPLFYAAAIDEMQRRKILKHKKT